MINKRRKSLKYLAFCLLLNTPFSTSSFANIKDNKSNVILEADGVTYDRDLNSIFVDTPSTIYKGDLFFNFNKLSYNTKKQEFSIHDVQMCGAGSYFEFDQFKSDKSLENASSSPVKGLIADGSYIQAKNLGREAGNTVFKDVSFTACDVGISPNQHTGCGKTTKNNVDFTRTKTPSWELFSRKIKQFQEDRLMSYHGSTLYLWGVPVFYIPYFTYPDFSVKRQSGLLPFTLGTRQSGYYIGTPYFLKLSDTSDATLTPVFSMNGDIVLEGEYRQNFKKGKLQLNTSWTDEDSVFDKRWYTKLDTRVHLNDFWKIDSVFERVSDATYLRVYDYSRQDTTTSFFNLGRYDTSSYLIFSAKQFQDLRLYSEKSEIPKVLPRVEYFKATQKNDDGFFWELNFDTTNLFKKESGDSKSNNTRATFSLASKNDYIFNNGLKTESSVSLRADAYNLDNVVYYSALTPMVNDGQESRFIPEAAIKLLYPLFKEGDGYSSILEPILQIVYSKDSKSAHFSNVPDNDSLDLELDENNLFSTNRYRGYDLVETGLRINYGLNYNLVSDDGKKNVDFKIGQGYVASDENYYKNGSGLRNNSFTDVVGLMAFRYDNFFNLYYRYRIDGSTYKINKNDIGFNSYFEDFGFGFSYIYSDIIENDNYIYHGKSEEVRSNISYKISDYWRVKLGAVYNVDYSQFTEWNGEIMFEDDCIAIGARFIHNYTSYLDFEANTSIKFTLSFKNFTKK